jgi:predicted ATPase/class 3 adenylate cyclase
MTVPTGPAVTFLFTDIEGSTRLERSVGTEAWAQIVADHDGELRRAIDAADGVVVKTEGDAFFAAFEQPGRAVEAIVAAQRALAARTWPEGLTLRVRAGLHLGLGRVRERLADDPQDYVGIDVNYTARIAAAANGGQVLLSDALVSAIGPGLDGILAKTGASVVDEGLRIVKDFEEPARLHRLVVPGVADDTRALRTLEAPTNLPVEATSLIGREAEIERLSEALGEGRIVTLTGPGGSGKTRLAIGVAEAVRSRFPNGVWFVDLAAVRDPILLEPTIASVLGVHESAGQAAEEAVRNYLHDREALVLLDNLEQLLPSAAPRVAALVRAAPRLRILVTSRELMRIRGERSHLVPPLDVEAGIALFEDRARLQQPDLDMTDESRAAISAISERLGGLPLAIELAAARIRLFGPAAILQRLGRSLDLAGGARDLPERQRTLRGAIDWSHDLLSDAEHRLFRRLAVFVGGWTTEDAAAVVDAEDDLGVDLLAGLESLADKSLIRIEPGGGSSNGDGRFAQHPLLREYGLEHLEASGEQAALETRHAAVFTAIAEAEGGRILTAAGEQALKRLDREQHNLRAAIDWSLRMGEVTSGLRIAAATWRWYQQRGRLREGRAYLSQMLEWPASIDDTRLRIKALAADGGLAYWMEDMVGARVRYEERLSLAEAIGDPKEQADAHYDIGFLYMVSEEAGRLREHSERALELYTAIGDELSATRAQQALVLVDFLAGDYAAARDREEQTLAAFRMQGSKFQVADSLTLLSAIYTQLGEVETAWRRHTEGLRIFADLDMASGLARALAMAAIIQIRFGNAEFGTRVAGATLELGRQKNVMVAPTKVLHMPAPEILAADILGQDLTATLLAEGAATPLDSMVAAVLEAPVPVRTSA